jgi:hypothetical protein
LVSPLVQQMLSPYTHPPQLCPSPLSDRRLHNMTIGRIPSVEGGIQPTILDAKGDLIVATAADTPARLAVGTNGQVLKADSSTATGLAWGTDGSAVFSGASIYPSADITLTNQTSVTITFDSESYDTDSYHSTSTNTSRMTVPSGKSGKYLSIANFTISTQTARVEAIMKLNGTTDIRQWTIFTSAPKTLVCATVLNLTAGDYLEIRLYNDSTSSANLKSDGGNQTQWSLTYLGA